MQMVKPYFELENYSAKRLSVRNYYSNVSDFYMLDGVIDPSAYQVEPIKIAAVLAEPYGYDADDGVVNIEHQPFTDVLGFPKIKTTLKLASLYWLLFSTLKNVRPMTYQELPYLFSVQNPNISEQANCLCATAWINVKKVPNSHSRAVPSLIYRHVEEHASILRQQLESVCADLVLICHQQAFDGLKNTHCLDGLSKMRDQFQRTKQGQLVLHVKHPSRWSYEYMHKIYCLLWEHFTLEK